MLKTEATGKTLDAAVDKALSELCITRDQADVTILQQGGKLKPFKVCVCKKLTVGEQAQDFLENVLSKMGLDRTVCEIHGDDSSITLNIVCADSNTNIIGYRGELLDALQYLVSLVIGRENTSFKRIYVDSENYRSKRERTLKQLARNLENKVKRTGSPTKLEPMNAFERRVIHTALQNSNSVSTESEGEGVNRHIIISPKLNDDILNAPLNSAGRKSLNFVYRSDKKRRR